MVAAERRPQGIRGSQRKRPEDTGDGCRALAEADRTRAARVVNDHMRGSFERSADAWDGRARLLDRLEASFAARAEAYAKDQLGARSAEQGREPSPVERGGAQADRERRLAEQRARPRITGLTPVADRKDDS